MLSTFKRARRHQNACKSRDLQGVKGDERSITLFLVANHVLLQLAQLLPRTLQPFVMRCSYLLKRRIFSVELLPQLWRCRAPLASDATCKESSAA